MLSARRLDGARQEAEVPALPAPERDLSLTGRDFLRISDLSPAEARALLDLAVELREQPKQPLLPGATLGLYFSKHSTRTRVSFTAGMTQLGGAAVPLTPEELQLSRGESLPDTARALSAYLDALAVRTHEHAELEAWAEWASIPVINALTAEEHPCQALADALTMRDRLGSLDGVKVAWVGDGSNVLVSLAALGELLGYEVAAACPDGYEPLPSNNLSLARDPRDAVSGADVVVTDTWISMGQEHERAKRLTDLEPYRLDAALLAEAAPDAFVMHCLPAHPGEEITADVLYGDRSAIWDEAENRLHVQKALLVSLLT
jgi:ornithine carbamoyltransferase